MRFCQSSEKETQGYLQLLPFVSDPGKVPVERMIPVPCPKAGKQRTTRPSPTMRPRSHSSQTSKACAMERI